jgi:hypothetical protein
MMSMLMLSVLMLQDTPVLVLPDVTSYFNFWVVSAAVVPWFLAITLIPLLAGFALQFGVQALLDARSGLGLGEQSAEAWRSGFETGYVTQAEKAGEEAGAAEYAAEITNHADDYNEQGLKKSEEFYMSDEDVEERVS